MTEIESPMFEYALKLLAGRDYTVEGLRKKLAARFGEIPETVIQTLISKRFLNDRRFAENYIARRANRGPARLREELFARGISAAIIDETLAASESPSLRDVVKAKMVGWKLRAPLQSRDAARLFRALARLGYEEDAIREEIEHLHEQ
jgi:SOS response regulatory protein OraA/RecX